MSNKRIAVYTANFGNYDFCYEPTVTPDNVDYICFTDNKNLKSDIWQFRYVQPIYDDPHLKNPKVRNARRFKALPHKFLSEYDYSVWHDTNFQCIADVNTLVVDYLADSNIGVYDKMYCALDPWDCIYEEARKIFQFGKINLQREPTKGVKAFKDEPLLIEKQVEKYRNENYPEHNGLLSAAIIVRRHNEKDCVTLGDAWWEEMLHFSHLDQMSFNYVAWKHNIHFNWVLEDVREATHFFNTGPHRSKIKKRGLLIATVHRVGERIYSAIPRLSELADFDLLLIDEMSNEMTWYGDSDPRISFHQKYNKYFTNTFDAGFHSTNQNPHSILKTMETSVYDLVIYDDDRSRYGLSTLYSRIKAPVFGCTHGSGTGFGSDRVIKGTGTIFDYIGVFGKRDVDENRGNDKVVPIGIPSNDILKEYTRTNEYILVIVNFLGNRTAPYKIKFDADFIEQSRLADLQSELKLPIVFKLKSRNDHRDVAGDYEYVKRIAHGLQYEIKMDVSDDNELISAAKVVISAPSTMAFKAIALKIPTICIKEAGNADGHWDNYFGLVDVFNVYDEYHNQISEPYSSTFLKETIEGGTDFSSTDVFINAIKKTMNI